MGWNRRKALLAGFLVAAIGCCLLAWPAREPSYQGKPLGAWLEAYHAGPAAYKPSAETEAALRAIGSDAVPYLLELMHTSSSFGKPRLTMKKIASITNNAGMISVPPPKAYVGDIPPFAQKPAARFLGNHTPLRIERPWIPVNLQHWKALAAMQTLGPLAEAAIPDLARLAHNTNASPSLRLATNSIMANTVRVPASMKLFEFSLADLSRLPLLAKFASNNAIVAPLTPGGPIPSFGVYSVFPASSPSSWSGDVAAWSLAAIGAKAVPALKELLANPDPLLQERAAAALGMVGAAAEPAVPALVDRLKSSNPEVRLRAAEALGAIARQPAVAVPPLIIALADADFRVQFHARNSLGQFGASASNAVPALLTNALAFPTLLRQAAIIALNRISPGIFEQEILPALLLELQDSMPLSRHAALETLTQLHSRPPAILPLVIAALDDPDKRVRVKAVMLLGSFGPAAKAAIPKLMELAKSSDSEIFTECVFSLNKIEPAWRYLDP